MSVGGDRVWCVQTKTRQPIPVEIWVLVAAAFLIALGFGIVARLPTRASIALFLATEAALLATIRDSLTLNVLMLVLPGGGLTEAIQAWQTAGR